MLLRVKYSVVNYIIVTERRYYGPSAGWASKGLHLLSLFDLFMIFQKTLLHDIYLNSED